jgi:catechol 2,3-dioxygenase-like lactoylglutathione lyase family enzyme
VTVELNHIIIPSRDKVASSRFLAEILGVDPPRPVSHFMAVETTNGVSLDYDDSDDFRPQHCAFLVGDDDFDAIFERVTAANITYSPTPPIATRAR